MARGGRRRRGSLCGRTYLPASRGLSLVDVRARESRTALPGDRPYPVVAIGKVPPAVGAELLAAVTPEARRQRLGVPCTMTVYLRTSSDMYTAYGIIGGP